MLIPEQNRFRTLCDSIASAFEARQITPESLLESLPQTRDRVFADLYPTLAAKKPDSKSPRRRSE